MHDGSPSEREKPGKRTTEDCCARLKVGPRPQGCCHTANGGNLRCHACMLMATSCVLQHCNASLTVEQIGEQVRTVSLLSAVQTHAANSERNRQSRPGVSGRSAGAREQRGVNTRIYLCFGLLSIVMVTGNYKERFTVCSKCCRLASSHPGAA